MRKPAAACFPPARVQTTIPSPPLASHSARPRHHEVTVTIRHLLVLATLMGPAAARGGSPKAPCSLRALCAGCTGREEGRPVDALVRALQDKDAQVRARAAEELGRRGTDGRPAVPALTKALEDESAAVRARAALALWEIDRPARLVLPGLLAARRDGDPKFRARAEAAWAQIGPGVRAGLGLTLKALKTGDAQAVKRASEALANV